MKKESLKKKRRKSYPPSQDPTTHSRSETRRSLRPRNQRHPHSLDDYLSSSSEDFEKQLKTEQDEKRRKLKLVLHLPTTNKRSFNKVGSTVKYDSESDVYSDEEKVVKPLKKRRIESCGNDYLESDGSGALLGAKRKVVRRSVSSVSGRTPLPKRMTLELVLDKLQKKDVYRVFAQPVDPDELPDYHDVIEHPMDFGTVRRKLGSGAYRCFEQFEDDVFLICSNAMQYNAPDTVYFRQARAIQDLARRKFQEIRADNISTGAEGKYEERKSDEKKVEERKSEEKKVEERKFDEKKVEGRKFDEKKVEGRKFDEKKVRERRFEERKKFEERKFEERKYEEKKVEKRKFEEKKVAAKKFEENIRFDSVEKKKLKKPQCRTASEPLVSDVSSGATLASAADTCTRLSPERATGPTSAADACTGLSTGQSNCLNPVIEVCTGLSAVQDNGVEKSVTTNGSVDGTSIQNDSKSENADEVPAKCSPSKPALKPFVVDENRRATYTTSEHQEVIEPDSVFDVFEGEPRQLVAVGLQSEYSYARSLAHFAASLGPLAWEIASKKIEQALPPGVKFGPGWVGEYEPLPTPILSITNSTQQQQLTALRQDKGNEIKLEAMQNGHCNDASLGCKSQKPTRMPSNGVSTTMKEGASRERTQVQKHGVFGVNLETQPKITRTMPQQQKDQAVTDCAKVCTNGTAVYRPASPELVNSKFPAIVSRDRNQVRLEHEKQLAAVTPKRRSDVFGMNVVGFSNGRSSDRPDSCPETVTSKFPPVISRDRNQMQPETGKQLEAATPKRRNDVFGMNVGGLSNGRSSGRTEFYPEAVNSKFPAVISRDRNQVQPEPEKQLEALTPKRRNDVFGMNVGGLSHGRNSDRPEFCSESVNSKFPAVVSRDRNQVQPEPEKQLEASTPKIRNDVFGVNVGGLSNGRSADSTRLDASFGISNHQAGVQYWIAPGSQEQAVNDPLRWMTSPGNISNQLNTSSRSTDNLQRSVPVVPPPRRENPSAAAARAWMSIGASAEWKSVDTGGLANKQPGAASFSNSTWKTPNPGSRIHDESKFKLEPAQGASDASQVQNKGLVMFPQLVTTDLSRLRSPWQGLVQHNKQNDMLPPDLNISFQPPGSPALPSSGIHIDSQQPDLALQL